jgi:oligopeptidase B
MVNAKYPLGFVKTGMIISIVSLFISGCTPSNKTADNMTSDALKAPVAKKVPYNMEQHGHERIDNYYWMRDDSREDKEILAHLEAENAFVDQQMAHTQSLQDTLFTEMTGRLKKDDASVPYTKRDYWWYNRYEGDNEYAIYARKKSSLENTEEVYLDANRLAKGHEYFSLGDLSVSTNNNILAYSTDTESRRLYVIEFKDLTTGEMYADKLVDTSGSIVWGNDNKTVFYIKKDVQTLLGYQVFRHTLGTKQEDDTLVYQEDDTTFYTYVGKTRDSQTIYIYHDSTLSTGASVISADSPNAEFKKITPITVGHEYDFDQHNDWYYIRTNLNAKNFKLVKVNREESDDTSKWQEVIPHRENVYFEDFIVFNNHLVLEEKENGNTNIRVINLTTNKETSLPFNDAAYVATFDTNSTADNDKLRYYYSSLTTPGSVMEVDLNTFESTTLKQDEVLGDFDPSWYQSERVFITARDGKKVPVSLVYRKDKFKKDGTNPVYQYAYGSYGATIEPYFSASRLSLLDRGFVYALAHIRGGQMLGRQWYEDGKMFNKINTFNDFIDVTKALTEQKYAAQDKVFAVGGSAGGLLMGGIMNMAPELYLGVAAHVPFVDVVTTMSDPSIPLTTNEYDEWGNPANKDSYEYMLSYSPYDQVKAQAYPNTLVTTGLHDSQVQYFEPMKWVAKLREVKTDSNKLYFQTNMDAGHGGASGRFRRYKELALEYAFFMDLIGTSK